MMPSAVISTTRASEAPTESRKLRGEIWGDIGEV